MPSSYTEGLHPGEAILSEANGTQSREVVTVVSGQDLGANTVVGIVTASGKYAVYDEDASDGTEDAAGMLIYAVDASAADAEGVIIARDAELNNNDLDWDTNDAADQAAGKVDLAALGIIVRD